VRSPSALLCRVLEIAVLSGQVHLDPRAVDVRLGAHQRGPGPTTPLPTPTTRARRHWGMGSAQADHGVAEGSLSCGPLVGRGHPERAR
jgi:hypothetical protein